MDYAKINEVIKGTKLVCDDGFTCMHESDVKEVKQDDIGLYVTCNSGKHYIDGQLDDGYEYIGLSIAN